MKTAHVLFSAALMTGFCSLSAQAATEATAQATMQSTARTTQHVTFQQIRNATIKLTYAGTTFLIDPMLAKRGAYPGFAGSYRSELRNPLVELPMPVADVIKADAVIVTHTHLDHWDEAAKKTLPKTVPLIAQDDTDAQAIRKDGFKDVRVLRDTIELKGTRISRAEGQHGSAEAIHAVPMLNPVMGIVFQRPGYRTVYVAGDTIWNGQVEAAIKQFQPDVIILNTGYARIKGLDGSIIMGKADLQRAYELAPKATIIGSHMDAVNHGMQTRAELRAFIHATGMDFSRVLVPDDGQSYQF
ncbi:MBL fold metallo-hydrolase [Pigmentiphaga litoralis]|uniref:L-ascorbate metabolism protein UlaG (Beta-lactamase superfamily) n=1 Tax=Pigmentiphaga litoralis TaxID=516702 RepID=A0A7Y9IRQ3_9BURK|nr:MBL fold metallo-hydrolase [Pigmentiphaga litoralis]NYE24603.1 L-ascorbate metabolism protein UlaG (beta-lactamase superfamily) [Pigmentiphaga litoralis]NYE81783.1 L-ascorbate metabolism protein UlaG (beta-lactamase superfamily) [Pigmentiphaga litoralis]